MITSLTLFLTTLTVAQGQALQVGYPNEPGLQSIMVELFEQRTSFVQTNQGWIAILGVDVDVQAGSYTVDISFTYSDGRQQSRTQMIEVLSKNFPTTELTVAPGYVQLSPENKARAMVESQEINAVYNELNPASYWGESFQVPIPGAIDGQNFGHRRIFNGEPRAPHSGADLSATTGTEIHASNAGNIVLAKDFFFNGNAVFIDHGLGVYTMYLHLSKILVRVGDFVERGQIIGLVGETGRVTGPHLHWGARILNARVDPFSLLPPAGDNAKSD